MEKRIDRRNAARVLIVEDDATTAILLSEVLSEDRHVVRTAASGREALRELKKNPSDVILCDLNLPDMSGLALLKKLRQSRRAFIPVIIISARADKDALVSGLAFAEDYLTKPVDPVELRARVRSMLRLKTSHDQAVDLNRSLETRVNDRTRALIDANKQLQAEVRRRTKSEREVRRLAAAVSRIQEEERARFSREIHDALGTSLLTLKLLIQTHFARRNARPKELKALSQVLELVDETTENARSLAHSLSPAVLSRLGFKAAVGTLLERLQASHRKITFKFTAPEYFPELSETWNREVYRIIQEAVLNSVKHAAPSEISVSISVDPSRITVRITDDGRGLTRSTNGGIGLLLMRERAAMLNASIKVDSRRETGMEVALECKNWKKHRA